MGHPRYRGPVIDAHCHFDRFSREHAGGVLRDGGLQTAIHLWDVKLPPARYEDDEQGWRELAPALRRCHVPDLSTVGEPGFDSTLVERLRTAASKGAVGVKIWKNLGLWERDSGGELVRIDDVRLDPLWSTAGELELPVVIHIGDPPAFFAPLDDDNSRIEELRIHPDWWWGAPGYPTLEELHEDFEHLVAGHPETAFIGAHFGCFMPWPEVRRLLDAYGNYHVDTAAAIADMGRDATSPVRDLILRHPDRVVFGTDLIRVRDFDMPELADRWDLEGFFDLHWRFFETADDGLPHPLPAQGPWTVTGLDLPDQVLERLYFANAARLFKLGDRDAG